MAALESSGPTPTPRSLRGVGPEFGCAGRVPAPPVRAGRGRPADVAGHANSGSSPGPRHPPSQTTAVLGKGPAPRLAIADGYCGSGGRSTLGLPLGNAPLPQLSPTAMAEVGPSSYRLRGSAGNYHQTRTRLSTAQLRCPPVTYSGWQAPFAPARSRGAALAFISMGCSWVRAHPAGSESNGPDPRTDAWQPI